MRMKTILKAILIASLLSATSMVQAHFDGDDFTEPHGFTYPARYITSSHANLRGWLSDDGGTTGECEYRFVWWADAGSKMATSWIPFGDDNKSASIRVSLLPDTQYSFQLEVKNSVGTYECLPRTFRTLAGITVPSNGADDITFNALAAATHPASSITSSGAILRGTLLGDGWLQSEYRFHYWADGGQTMATSWIPFDYADDDNDDGNIIASRPVSLAPGTQYTFQIEVRNALDTFVSPPRTFHTLAGIPIPSNEPPKYNTSNELRGNTYPARFITSSHAVLRGGLLGDGWLPSKYRFHYWSDGGPTITTSWTAFDEDNIIASRRVSLEPDTQYTFQLEVRNAEDTYECLPRTFRTLAN